MLSYELCLKLKEAGFPQDCEKSFCGCGCQDSSLTSAIGESLIHRFGTTERVAFPNLSELIAECKKVNKKDILIFSLFDDKNYAMKGNFRVEGYETPEETLANLFLALNHEKTTSSSAIL